MKAVLLSAGLGTRLLPVTQKTPKPCVPILNIPLVYWNLLFLKEAGIQEVAINTHHLADKVAAVVEKRPSFLADLKIHFSDEKKEILGTGGGVKNLERWIQPAKEFLVFNSDVLTDAPLSKLILKRQESGATSMMLVKDHPELGKKYRPIVYDKTSFRLLHVPPALPQAPIENSKLGLFAGIQCLSSRALDFLPPRTPSDMIEYAYSRMLQAGEPLFVLSGEFNWFDIGSPQSLFQTHIDLLHLFSGSGYDDILRSMFKKLVSGKEEVENVWIGNDVHIADECLLVPPVVIGNNVRLDQNSVIGPYSVVPDGMHIKKNTVLKKCVILSDSAPITPAAYESTLFVGTSTIKIS